MSRTVKYCRLDRDNPPPDSSSTGSCSGILDENQTSCTLVTIPTSPQASEIEAAKTLLMMKDKDGSFSEETVTQNVETNILTEADIVKHVHVHSNNQPTAPIKAKAATLELWKLWTLWKLWEQNIEPDKVYIQNHHILQDSPGL